MRVRAGIVLGVDNALACERFVERATDGETEPEEEGIHDRVTEPNGARDDVAGGELE